MTPEQEKQNTYTVFVKCENCGVRRNVSIRKGNLLIDERCQNCGCDRLRREVNNND